MGRSRKTAGRVAGVVAPLLLVAGLCACGKSPAATPHGGRSPGGTSESTATSGPRPTDGRRDVVTYEVAPAITAAGLSGPQDPDLAAVDPAVPQNGELFVFLPGTGGQPDCCRDLIETAARTGFLAVGLAYLNAQAVGRICGDDLTCYATVRQDDFDGSAPSPFSHVDATDSIQARLVDLLRYLASSHPSQGWEQFIDGAAPAWSRIVVAGHSQGGGDAAYIAKIRQVEGVVLLAAPVDSSTGYPPVAADYLTTGHLTPLARYVGFDHTRDPFHDKIVADWAALGLQSFGPARSVDGDRSPFGGSHELLTSTTVPPGPAPVLATHDSTAVDSQTPTCPDGSTAFVPVWRYMMQVAGGLAMTGGQPTCTA